MGKRQVFPRMTRQQFADFMGIKIDALLDRIGGQPDDTLSQPEWDMLTRLILETIKRRPSDYYRRPLKQIKKK